MPAGYTFPSYEVVFAPHEHYVLEKHGGDDVVVSAQRYFMMGVASAVVHPMGFMILTALVAMRTLFGRMW